MNNRLKIAHEFANDIITKGITHIILFGSVARGDDKKESDIDILIVCKNREDIEFNVNNKVFDIIDTYEEFIEAHIMTEDYYNKTKEYSFLKNVLKEGVPLVGDY